MNGWMLFRTARGAVVQCDGYRRLLPRDWNDLIREDDLAAYLARQCADIAPDDTLAAEIERPLAPVVDQEVWAAGVTWLRSREARREESRKAGGGSFYDRVYDADRPELFLKATPQRLAAPGETMRLRRDSQWIVPEPELVVVLNPRANIVGYTIGNDLSCRDIEGENPLYLPQAKTFDRCAAVGPGILVTADEPSPDTAIRLVIRRDQRIAFEDSVTLARMKRKPRDLADWLFREMSFPAGCLLMTGTGIVPPDEFSLRAGDRIEIGIDGLGTLENPVA